MNHRIFLAGRIYSDFGDSTRNDAMVTFGDRVVTIGTRAELIRRFQDADLIDLGDTIVVPGFNDAHQHPSMVAADLLYLDFSPGVVRNLEEIKSRLRDAARRTPKGEWIRGSRYDHSKMSAEAPLSRQDLDDVAPDHPVVVSHISAHWGVANSRALALAQIDEASEEPRGGVIGRDSTGRLNGVLSEQAFFNFAYSCLGGEKVVVPTPDLESWLEAFDRIQTALAAAGITSVTDALVGPDEFRLFQEARRRGLLRLRVNMLITYPYLELIEGIGMQSGFGDPYLRFEGIKVIVDGSVSAGTCLLAGPDPGARPSGVQVVESEQLRRIIDKARRAKCRLAIHANGDQAITQVLDELDRADQVHGPPTEPDRIEHCSVISPNILTRLAERNVGVTPFGAYVHFHGDALLERYGNDQLEWMFAHRGFIDAGVIVGGASDYPCGPFEPLTALRSCTTRRSSGGQLLGGTQQITAREALDTYTMGSASVSGQEAEKGCLAPGFLADFVVLDRDPCAISVEELADIAVVSTFVGGEEVWASEPRSK